jgi:hypothetical protein
LDWQSSGLRRPHRLRRQRRYKGAIASCRKIAFASPAMSRTMSAAGWVLCTSAIAWPAQRARKLGPDCRMS